MNIAQQAFTRLQFTEESLVSPLLSGFIKYGKVEHALSTFDRMLVNDDSQPLNNCIFGAHIKTCTRLKRVDQGLQIHAEVVRLGLLECDIFLCSALVGMYAKCGLLAKAEEVFVGLPARDVVCWTALMTGLSNCGFGKEAFNSFRRMQLESISPDAVSFLCGIKACSVMQAADIGNSLHAEAMSLGLLKIDPLIGTALVDMYAKCGCILKSQIMFDKLLHRDCISWNTLIAGYVEQGHDENAINLFEQMQLEGVSADAVTFGCALSACGSINAIDRGEKLHAEIARKGLQTDLSIGNSLLDFYARCGLLGSAKELFNSFSYQDVVSWTTLIGGYADYGYGEEALGCLKQMQTAGIPPNTATYICCLKACGTSRLTDEAHHLYREVERRGLFPSDFMVANAVVDMYSKCGMFNLACQVFDKLLVQDVVSWTTLIAGYVQHGCYEQALECFDKMKQDGVSPNAFTYVCVLKACGVLGAIDFGREVHGELKRNKEMQNNCFLDSMIVNMYAKCGSLDLAHKAFDGLVIKDVISWTTLVAGYVEDGREEDAVECIEQMQREGVPPNAVTHVCSLKAYSSIGAVDKVEDIHRQAQVEGLLELEPVLRNTLVHVYAKRGELAKAQAIFHKLHELDMVSLTALSGGYYEHCKSMLALDCCHQIETGQTELKRYF